MPTSTTLRKESRAWEAVKRYERAKGGKPRRSRQGSGYDAESRGRKIEIKTIPRVGGGFRKLGQRQFRILCATKNYWVYLVDVSKPKARIFEFSREEVLPRIRPYIHYDFVFTKSDLLTKRPVSR